MIVAYRFKPFESDITVPSSSTPLLVSSLPEIQVSISFRTGTGLLLPLSSSLAMKFWIA